VKSILALMSKLLSTSMRFLDKYCKIGIRRTGISSFYHGEELVKQKEKKTSARSKYKR
jgi:hypothetical protein